MRNPYKGLRAFGEQDSPDFFGREALVARLVERLGEVARAGRLLAVVGASGSGKSSAVRAGLIPALRASALPGSERWRVAVMQPGARPIRELAAALSSMGDAAQPQLAERLAEQLDGDGDLAGAIAGALPDDVPHLVLVIDQLEELWSLAEDACERTRFVVALVGALAVRDARLLVVATLRADFLDRPLANARARRARPRRCGADHATLTGRAGAGHRPAGRERGRTARAWARDRGAGRRRPPAR